MKDLFHFGFFCENLTSNFFFFTQQRDREKQEKPKLSDEEYEKLKQERKEKREQRDRERQEKREKLKNKERPAMQIYRPGMGKFSSQTISKSEETELANSADESRSDSKQQDGNNGKK